MATCSKCGRDTRRYQSVPGVGDFCIGTCAPGFPKRMKLSTFPFETECLSSQPGKITVNSLPHLRRLEAEHGVASVAYNCDHPETYHPGPQKFPNTGE